MAANRRKMTEQVLAFGPTATSGVIAQSDSAASHDSVTFYIDVSQATAGSITFKIQTSAYPSVWHDMASGEMTGNTGAITDVGTYRISSAAPIGLSVRLVYTIVTGPFECSIIPCYEKSGSVF